MEFEYRPYFSRLRVCTNQELEDVNAMQALAHVLQTSTTLEKVNLLYNRIGAEGAAVLQPALTAVRWPG
jgi:hypothetical protein